MILMLPTLFAATADAAALDTTDDTAVASAAVGTRCFSTLHY